MNRYFIILAMCFSSVAFASSLNVAWKPHFDFKLENSDSRETMHWVSGWSYALTSQIKYEKSKGLPNLLCLNDGEEIGSKFIVDTLNTKFGSKTISADEAAPIIWSAIMDHFGCK